VIRHDALVRIVRILEQVDVRYMVVGSLASTYWGQPRSTNDIDIVVELDARSLESLLERVPRERYYVPEGLARDAVAQHTMFNLIDQDTGWKVDLVVRKERPFSQAELARRVRQSAYGTELWLASAEDTILAKLEWAERGESDRHLRDIAGILAVCGEELDLEYVDRWAEQLGVGDAWCDARPHA